MSAPVSRKGYTLVWLALVALLFATWLFSNLNLKLWNLAIAIGIAIAKMLLIFFFFMEGRRSERLVWVIAGAGFVCLIVMIDLTMSDYLTR